MIFSKAKPFNEKICKIIEKKKEHVSIFSILSIDDMKTKRNTNLHCWFKNTQQ